MSDPFSLTTGAVGVISLGLTVCQGLLAYYGPYKAFHEEIEEMTCRAHNLDMTMRMLEKMLNGSQSSGVAEKAECAKIAMRTIQHCEQRLRRLEEMLKKCGEASGSQSLLKARIHINRMLFPFRRETLVSMVSMVNGLQNNLNTALQMLNYTMMTANEEQMGMVVSSAASAASGTSQVLNAVRNMSQTHVSLDEKLKCMEHRLNQMETSIVRHQMQSTLSPSLLRLLLDNQHDIDEEINRVQNNSFLWVKCPEKDCTCLHGNKALASPRRARPTKSSHGKMCSFDHSEKRLVSIRTHQAFCNWLLKLSVTVSLEIAKGARGLSISPSLSFRAVVLEDCAMFKLLAEKQQNMYSAWLNNGHSEVDDALRDTSSGSLENVQQGRASPTDVSSSEKTQGGLVPSHRTLATAFAANYKACIKLPMQTKGLCIGPEWLQIFRCSSDIEIQELAVQELASRRKRLQRLAQTYLPGKILSRLRMQSDCLLDSTVGDVYRSLEALSVDIGFVESEVFWLVYSLVGTNMTLTDLQ